MTKQLREALLQPGNYFFGIQNYAVRKMGKWIFNFIKRNAVGILWHEADVCTMQTPEENCFRWLMRLRKKRL